MLERLKKLLPFKRGDRAVRRVETLPESFHPLARLEHELHRLAERIGGGWLGPTSDFGSEGLESWFGDFSPARFLPTLDLADRRKHFEVTVELPGMDPEDIDVEVRNGALVIRGEKRFEETAEDEGYYRTERAFGAFERVVPLPGEIDPNGVDATFKKGVLRIRLPKARPEEHEGRKIPVKVS